MTISVIKPKKNNTEWAIECIEDCARLYKVKFVITFKGVKGDYTSTYTGRWRIDVMGKTFVDDDFVKCASEAVGLVYNANEYLNKKK